jgi:hypothetical protein
MLKPAEDFKSLDSAADNSQNGGHASRKTCKFFIKLLPCGVTVVFCYSREEPIQIRTSH